MADRDPLDVQAIAELAAENIRITSEFEMMAAAYGSAQLRIQQLERQLGERGGNQNIRQFQRQREDALENARRES